MEELIKALYDEFAAKAAAFTAQGVLPIATIDRYRGQPMNPEQFEYYELPALFIERSIKWERVNKVYNGVMELNFHLVSEPTWEASNIATNAEEGLKYYRLLAMVRSVLDNFKFKDTSTFERTIDHPIESGVVMYDVIGYYCEYYDQGIIGPVYDEAQGDDLSVQGTFVKKLTRSI